MPSYTFLQVFRGIIAYSGMTKERIAEDALISRSTVANAYQGENLPNWPTVLAITYACKQNARQIESLKKLYLIEREHSPRARASTEHRLRAIQQSPESDELPPMPEEIKRQFLLIGKHEPIRHF